MFLVGYLATAIRKVTSIFSLKDGKRDKARMLGVGRKTASFLTMQGKRNRRTHPFTPLCPLPVSITAPHWTSQSAEKWREKTVDLKSKGHTWYRSKAGEAGTLKRLVVLPVDYVIHRLMGHLLSIYCGVRHCCKSLGTERSIAPNIWHGRED